ncbi:hypothetical protein KP509_33G013100 [Ceratopteris richardii]|uniref:Reverse transcriptase domain-containing protein n=1 Tax=Ceratopteris richardii TaxID=49495 RepID=A0A8T2QMU1_CERRI|nr:hypothetical protein KP509_33G013100 [Ceratopteris richardii]
MLNCRDLWGYIGGHTLRFTYHSRSHKKAMSRLDRCYYSQVSTLNGASKMWVDATVLLSDHSPLLVSLTEVDWSSCIPFNLSRIPLRVNHTWMQTSLFKSKVKTLIQLVLSLRVSACMKWEFLVVKLQDIIRECGITFSRILNAAKHEAQQCISLMVERVDSGHLLSQEDYSQFCKAYKCLELIENQAIKSSKVRARCTEVNDLHANSKCFFYFLRFKHLKDTISHLEVDGSIVNDGNAIAEICSEHFRNLFAASYKSDDAWFEALHASLAYTPQLLDSHMAASCEKIISEEEVFMALQSLKNGKAPGLDGITKEFVIAFWPLLKNLVELNGRLTAPFPIERSVRQSCPLSPLFYALASSPMFYLLEAKVNSQCIHGISLHGVQQIAVGFADDTFIFAKAERENIKNILHSLAPFSQASALKINMRKSAIINISAQKFQDIEWEGPKIERGTIFRHLGYPLGVGVPIKDKVDWVLHRVKGKMDKWFASQWPLHARIRIVQAFMQPYVMYYLLLLDWKKNNLHIFHRLIKTFLWSKKHSRAFVLSSWEYVCKPKDKGGLGILNLHTHLMARNVKFKGTWKLDTWNKFFSHVPLQTSSRTINMLLCHFKSTLSTLRWNGRQHYVGNSFASISPYWSFLSNLPIALLLGAAGRYFNNKGIDSIAKYYDSKWELLPFSVLRKSYALGAAYRSKWLQVVSFIQQYQIPLSIDAVDPWRDWVFAKHTRWWAGNSNMYYRTLIASDSIACQCNRRWNLKKNASWWCSRFGSIWESSFTYKMKIFMWRIFVGHFTLGAFLSKHGLQGVRCPHCASYAENMRHAFWSCAHVQRCWNTLFLFPIWTTKPTKFGCTFLLFDSTNTVEDWVKRRCVFLLLRNIWMRRNFKMFKNKMQAPSFSWQYCKTQLWRDSLVMPSADRTMIATLLNAF